MTARLPGPSPVPFLTTRWLQDLFLSPANPGYSEVAALFGNIWDKGIFSWVCINYELDNKNSYPTFSQTLPCPIQVLLTVMEYFPRAHAGVTSSNEDI